MIGITPLKNQNVADEKTRLPAKLANNHIQTFHEKEKFQIAAHISCRIVFRAVTFHPVGAEPTGSVPAENNLVRLSKITVDPTQLKAYNACLKEEIEASLRIEPGVLTLYAVAEKEVPNKITILEIYADRTAYENHLKTPHFRKYKQDTLKMVENLELIDTTPLIPGLKIK